VNPDPQPSPPSTVARRRPAEAPVLGVVLLAALLLRVLEARGARLWFDEIYVVMVARQAWSDLLRTVASDIHPPLHFLFVHAWRALGGEGTAWLKSASIGFSLAGIAATWAFARRFWSPRAGLIAAAFLALDNAHLHFSQEVEAYPLLWLAAVGVACFGAGWVESRRARDAAGFVACAVLGAYTHYLVLVLFGLTTLWGVAALHRERGALARWLGLAALVLVLFAPQAPVLARQWVQEGSGAYFHWPSQAGLLSLGRAGSLGALYLLPLFGALAIVALADPGRRHRAALLWAVCALTPLFTRAWPWVVNRDMLVVLPFWYVLAAAGLDRLRRGHAGLVLAGVLLLFGVRSWRLHEPFLEPRSLARAEQVIAAEMPPGTLVVHTETHSLLYFRFYRPNDRNLLLYPAGQRVPFFDAGLVIPPEWLLSPEDWGRGLAAGEPWWGVHCDRAYVTRGVVYRAGERPEHLMDSLATGRRWEFPPVVVWEGVADSARAAAAAR
jgi:hypothetical protein